LKKSFGKIIIGAAFLAVVAAGIYIGVIKAGSTEEVQGNDSEIIMDIPEDYLITESINILVNRDSYVHTDETVIIGTLTDIIYADEKINRFIIESAGEEYRILYNNLDLISTETIKTEDVDGIDEVKLHFRTGSSVTLIEGEQVKLYKNAAGAWTLDERMHKSSDADEMAGTVDDFVFLPSYEQGGDIYISHIVVKDDSGETVNVYPYNMDVTLIKSNGDMIEYYAGDANGNPVFDTKESGDFYLIIKTKNGDFSVKKGEEINLEKNPDRGYWEISRDIDTTRYEAVVEGFVFGHIGDDITSLDYINLAIDGETKIQITMLQTQADYAVPYGNYKKIYTYYGHDKVLTGIEPMDDWKTEFYYGDDIVVNLSVGASVWVYKNEDNIWIIDYMYEKDEEPEE